MNRQLNVELNAHSFKVLTTILINRKHIELVRQNREEGYRFTVTPIGTEFINKTDYCLGSWVRYRFQNLYKRNKKLKRIENKATILLAITTILLGLLVSILIIKRL